MTSNSVIQFGTDGWRGPIAETFTFANVRKATRAIAAYLDTQYLDPDTQARRKPILIGYDTRFLADRFANQAAQILAHHGWPVRIATRDCPTPAIAYAAHALNSAGAITFTASHNPPPDCGLKYIPHYAGPATTDITNAITHFLATTTTDPIPPTPDPSPLIQSFDPRPLYLDHLYTQIDCDRLRHANLTIVYDALYSTSRGYLDQALTHCGCTVKALHTHRDVLFGGGMPEPKPKYLTDLQQHVTHLNAAMGMATDGDSDRFGIIDDRGQFVSANTIMMILVRHLVRNRGLTGAIVRTVGTTHLLDRLATHYGLDIYETPVGFKHIGALMREIPVLIGGEESGGLSVLGHIPEKDGMLANLLVAEAIAYEYKPLSTLAAEAITEAGGPTVNFRLDLRLTEDHKQAAMATMRETPPSQVAGFAVKTVGQKDGVKLYLENGAWVLIRPSGTEPVLRVSMEAASEAVKEAIAADMQAKIMKLAD